MCRHIHNKVVHSRGGVRPLRHSIGNPRGSLERIGADDAQVIKKEAWVPHYEAAPGPTVDVARSR